MPRRPLRQNARVSFRNPLIVALLASSMLTSSVQARQQSSQPASGDSPATPARGYPAQSPMPGGTGQLPAPRPLTLPDTGQLPTPVPLSSGPSGTGHRIPPVPGAAAPTGKARARLVAGYGRLAMGFEPNVGQVDRRVAFIARGSGYTLYLTATGATLALRQSSTKAQGPLADGGLGRMAATGRTSISGGAARSVRGASAGCGTLGGMAVRGLAGGCLPGALGDLGRGAPAPVREDVVSLRYVGANARPRMAGAARLPGIVNYFIGKDPKHWHTRIPTYARVVYRDVYPGIDLAYYGNGGRLEYDWVVRPGADAGRIRMAVGGAGGVRLDGQGNLLVGGKATLLRQAPAAIYQTMHGVRRAVAGQYTLLGDRQVGFALGRYDRGAPLVIDPVLSYSTFLGGNQPVVGHNDGNGGSAIAVDGAGDAYVTGFTESINFPTTSGAYQLSLAGSTDAFVTELNAAGSALVYSSYLGGTKQDSSTAIAVDRNGDAYVTGSTYSADFPITSGAIQPLFVGGTSTVDAFVAELNPAGSQLLYATYLSGSQGASGSGIAVDFAGAAYITGVATADFPTTSNALQPVAGSGGSFVVKLNAAGSGLAYSTYLDGTGGDSSSGIAVDGNGEPTSLVSHAQPISRPPWVLYNALWEAGTAMLSWPS